MSEHSLGPVGPYQPERQLAAGTYSVVWRASGPQGTVVLKLPRTVGHRTALAREAELLQRLDHPNLVKVVDHDPDYAWVALEYVAGAPLDQWSQVQDTQQIMEAAAELTRALAYLHSEGIVHGDLKPANVLVTALGDLKLIDLGLAVAPGTKNEGGFQGTLGYAAPELLRGEPCSVATDLYGLGAILYTCCANRTPFVAADPAALTYLPLVSLPAPPSTFRPEMPVVLDRLVLSLLARDGQRRPPLESVSEDLAQPADGPPSKAVFGMHSEREELRRAVVGAVDGEPRVVVIYGPPGSGRRTLIAETVEAARREGLTYLRGTDVNGGLVALRGNAPPVLVMRARGSGPLALAKTMLQEKLPGLLLLHADRPVPALASTATIHLTPSPLDESDIAMLAQVHGADPSQAKIWRRESMGLPVALIGRIQAWKQNLDGSDPDLSAVPKESRRILEILKRASGAVTVEDLARHLKQTEHTVLDHCEVLLAQELAEEVEDGRALQACRPSAS